MHDLLLAGTDEFRKRSSKLDQCIKMKPASDTPLTFAGLRIQRVDDGTVLLNKKEYTNSLEKQSDDFTFEVFRSYRHKLA